MKCQKSGDPKGPRSGEPAAGRPVSLGRYKSYEHTLHVGPRGQSKPKVLGECPGKSLDADDCGAHNRAIRWLSDAGRGSPVKQLQELVVELTDRCPMGCRHCSSGSGPACHSELSQDVVLRILAEAAGLGTQHVSFGGGEPTVAPLFLQALRETIRHGFSAEVFTCGVTFSTKQKTIPLPESLVRDIVALGGKPTFVFSFHGSCSAVHDSITCVRGSLECLTESLQRCLASGISCAANFVPTRVNALDLSNTADLVEALGIAKLSILRFVPQGRGLANRDLLELSRDEEDRVVQEIIDLRDRTDLEVRTGSPFNGIIPDNNVPCRAGFQKLVIQADGNVLPCEVFKDEGRRDWGASVYQMSLGQIMGAPQFGPLQKILFEGPCTACPVHSILRAKQRDTRALHGIPKAAV